MTCFVSRPSGITLVKFHSYHKCTWYTLFSNRERAEALRVTFITVTFLVGRLESPDGTRMKQFKPKFSSDILNRYSLCSTLFMRVLRLHLIPRAYPFVVTAPIVRFHKLSVCRQTYLYCYPICLLYTSPSPRDS